MKTAIVLFFLLLALTAVVSLLILFWQYRSWPPAQWKERLLGHVNGLQRTIAEQDDNPDAKQEAKLRIERLQAYLLAIPLSRLADYPGIGPKTVESLENSGFKHVEQMWKLKWWASVPGIGEVRAKALTEAAQTIKTDAETKFENGQCDEGRAWIAERDALRAGYQEAAKQRDWIKAAANRAIRECQPLVDLAKSVTFPAYLFHKAETPITADVMNRPFPVMSVDEPKPTISPPLPPPVIVVTPTPTAPTPEPVELKLPADDPGLDRMRAYCRFGFVIARADGRVAVAEKKVIRQFLVDHFSSDARLLRYIDPIIEQCENPPPVESDVVAELKECTGSDERQELVSAARRIVDATGDRNQKEQNLIDRIAAAFGIGGNEKTSETPTPTVSADPLEILGIPPKAELTPELVRRRLNILLDQYDPAKATGMGSEFVAMAEQKRNGVKNAAELLLKRLGAPLVAPPPPPPPPAIPGDIRHNPDLDAIFGS